MTAPIERNLARTPIRLAMGAIAAVLGVSLALLAACGGSSGGASIPVPDPKPKIEPNPRVAFLTQPDDGLAGFAFGGPILVHVTDENGSRLLRTYEGMDITMLDPSGRAELSGTLRVPVVDGVAEFTDLMVERGGRDLVLIARLEGVGTARSVAFRRATTPFRRHVIVMIADGWGYKQIEATRRFTHRVPIYAGFENVAMTTGDEGTRSANGGVIYDPGTFWSNFDYAISSSPADSASSATSMYTGIKTETGRIGVGPGTTGEPLRSIGETAIRNGLWSGAVTSVPIPHATPAAWVAHNDSRHNYGAIVDEMLFGDPQTTGPGLGGHGRNRFLPHVLIGGGNPNTSSAWISRQQIERAAEVSPEPGSPRWTVVQRDEQGSEGPRHLLAAAANPTTERLLGVFGGAGGNIALRRHDGSGTDPRDATLAEMTSAALTVLERSDDGFVLMVEGGAIDWAGHGNDLSACVGEMIGFEEAVEVVVRWIGEAHNGSSWDNTLLIVTGDHETGYLTAWPGAFADRPLGRVTDATLRSETTPLNYPYRASWDDTNQDGNIDPGETVHWSWNSNGHSNSLIPCYFRGVESARFRAAATRMDPVRGVYLDNTDIFRVMLDVLER